MKIALIFNGETDSPLIQASMKVIGLLSESANFVPTLGDADLVISNDGPTLLKALKQGRYAYELTLPGEEKGTGLATAPQFADRFKSFNILNFIPLVAAVSELASRFEDHQPEVLPDESTGEWKNDGRQKVLVVDDNELHRRSAREKLSEKYDLVVLDNYTAAFELLMQNPPDTLLSDLLMPAESKTLGPEGLKFLGHEMPIGLILALKAVQVGVRRVTVITDMNHHNHPMAAALDWILNNPLFTMNNAQVRIDQTPLDKNGAKDWNQAMLDTNVVDV